MTDFTPEPLPRARVEPGTSTRNGTPRMALLVGGVVGASLITGFGLASVLVGPNVPDLIAASGQPSPSAQTPVPSAQTPVPSAQTPIPTSRPTHEPSASPTAVPVALLSNNAVATVTTDALNLRQSASESSDSLTLLEAGTELFVIGEPQVVGDLRWYRVATGSFDAVACGEVFCDGMIGWAATPADGAMQWIEAVEVNCPGRDTSVDQLVAMTEFERLHCYGTREFTATGWADNDCCGYIGAVEFEPAWIAWPPWRFFRASDFYTVLRYAMPPTGDDQFADLPEPGDVLRFTAHFDDPAAPECRAVYGEDLEDLTVEGLTLPSRSAVVLGCRLRLVVTDYEVIGHEGDGSCGCLTPPSPSATKLRSVLWG
jgi:hypothetical protein